MPDVAHLSRRSDAKADLRWGLLSTARINRRVIPAIRSNPRAVLAAVASRDLAQARTYARTWDIPRAHGSYDDLLRDPGVDVIYIGLPNALHVEWTLRAIEAGKHVLCEKPVALTPADVDRIVEATRARHVVVTEGFMYRHEPLTDRVLDLLASDAIGPLRSMQVGFTYRRTRDADVRLLAELGGGCLWDVGCYPVSYARLLAGAEPTEVFGWAAWGASGVDEIFTGLLRFPNDVVASVHASFRAEYRMWADVSGADAALRVANPFKPSPQEPIELQRGDLVQTVDIDGSPELFVREIEDMVSAVLDGRPPRISLEESRGNAATLAALYESARTGRAIRIPTRPSNGRG
jgi:xylose dehydrogenase (NAD/NADP)